MIENELRIGNLLMWEDGSKEIISITGILKRDGYYSVSFDGGCAQLDEFIPVPLTEENIIKLGFKKDDYGYGGYLSPIFGKQQSAMRIYLKDGCCYHVTNLERIELENVHDLQNLYYAFSKKELALK